MAEANQNLRRCHIVSEKIRICYGRGAHGEEEWERRRFRFRLGFKMEDRWRGWAVCGGRSVRVEE